MTPDAIAEYMDAREMMMREWVRGGFVDGNLETHRLAHEAMILAAKEQRELWMDIRKKLATGGVTALLGGLATAIIISATVWVKGLK
ncbi:MAG: hypothetical protein ACK5NW_10390 [Ottowia sp.]